MYITNTGVMNKDLAIIFTGGAMPDFQKIKDQIEKAKITVAADSGWDSAIMMGIFPDVYIGDMDSIKNKNSLKTLSSKNKIIYKKDKDYSDTELAIKYLKENNYEKIIIVGGGEGRLDHLLAILATFTRKFKPQEWYTAKERIVHIKNKKRFSCNVGKTISIFALPSKNPVVSTKGLKWELIKFKMNEEHFSLSNIAISDEIFVKVESGEVLIIFNY